MNMVNQGTYSNPLVTAYLFPARERLGDIRMYERWDSDRKLCHAILARKDVLGTDRTESLLDRLSQPARE